MNKIIKYVCPEKATGSDETLMKIVKLSANVINSHLAI